MFLNPKVNVFECFHAVACGDVVLVIELVGAVARGPNAANIRTLGTRVGLDSSYGIKFKQSFCKIRVRHDTHINEDAGDSEFLYRTRLLIFIF